MDAVAVCADVSAGWHTSWLTALGLRSVRRGAVWRALDTPPLIYWTAITLARDASPAAVAGAPGTVCDSWSALDLSSYGFELRASEPWLMRPPGELHYQSPPAELEVVCVSTPSEVAEFESVSLRGFGGEGASTQSMIHPPSILDDAGMTMLTGRVDGQAVAAAMGYRTKQAAGIFGVTTIVPARRRGYASALTRALVDPCLPVILSASHEGERLYRRLGFEPVGELRQWTRVEES